MKLSKKLQLKTIREEVEKFANRCEKRKITVYLKTVGPTNLNEILQNYFVSPQHFDYCDDPYRSLSIRVHGFSFS